MNSALSNTFPWNMILVAGIDIGRGKTSFWLSKIAVIISMGTSKQFWLVETGWKLLSVIAKSLFPRRTRTVISMEFQTNAISSGEEQKISTHRGKCAFLAKDSAKLKIPKPLFEKN